MSLAQWLAVHWALVWGAVMVAVMIAPPVYHLILRLRLPKRVCFASRIGSGVFLSTACGYLIEAKSAYAPTKDVAAVTCRACMATDAYHAALDDAIDWPAIIAENRPYKEKI